MITEEEVRKIAREEAAKIITLIKEEVSGIPLRADGNLNVRDFYFSLGLIEERVKTQ